MRARILLYLLLTVFNYSSVLAQMIHGEVRDIENKQAITGVSIENIYTNVTATTDSTGRFVIAAASGQLLEFNVAGYKITRVRIPHGFVPQYFKILMEHPPVPIGENEQFSNRYDNKKDSIKYRELYKHELDFPKLSAIEKIRHPFSALSAKNREIWQFQDDFSDFEKEKYVDNTFNRDIISKITGLKNDSLTYYMRRFRPTYESLRGMNDYTFYNYIKNTAHRFRSVNRPIIAE